MQVDDLHNTSLNLSHQLTGDDFYNACHDYFYLIDRHFPERGVLKLVGDRYRLDGDQRTVLYRGIASGERSLSRKSRLVSEIVGQLLLIDGYNVLFTLLNYRLGHVTFISTDNLLRDAGSLHGRLRDEKTFLECMALLIDYIKQKEPRTTTIYLDSPVSHSEKHAQMIRDSMQKSSLNGDCLVVKSADWALKQHQNGVLATSDSAIIDKGSMPVIDLSRQILNVTYRAVFPDLHALLVSGKGEDPVDKC